MEDNEEISIAGHEIFLGQVQKAVHTEHLRLQQFIFKSHVGRCNMVLKSFLIEDNQIIMDSSAESLCFDLSVIRVDEVIYLSATTEQFTVA